MEYIDDLIIKQAENTLTTEEASRWSHLLRTRDDWEFAGVVTLDENNHFVVVIPLCRAAVIVESMTEIEIEAKDRVSEILHVDFDSIHLHLDHQYLT